MLVFVFPGQGSQKRGMGKELFDQVREFADNEKHIDALLGYSVRTLCLEDPANQLNDTRYTQVALYVVNALHYYQAVASGPRADALAGHSLGEYDALLAAGAFDFLTGLRLVQKRGELMGQAKNGAMAAVIGLSADRIAALRDQNGLHSLDIANHNSPTQIVISGPVSDIERAGPIMEAAGARLYMRLPVSAAFHSRYMVEAAKTYETFLQSFEFKSLQTRVVSNVTGDFYPIENPTHTIRSLLVKQISQPVQWTQSVRRLLDQGAATFKEIGPGTVLTRLIQQIQQA